MNACQAGWLVFLGGFAVSVTAATYHDALDAQGRGDFTTAAQAWKQLATAGDPVAQYNLALLYQNGQGVKSDAGSAQHWLTQAARQGLTQAYKQLNTDSVKPSTASAKPAAAKSTAAVTANNTASRMSDNHRRVMDMKPDYYTIQLVSSTNEEVVAEYFRDNQLAGKATYYRSYRQGQMWYSLVYGEFPTVAESNTALATLPANLKKWSPWIRHVSDIQRIIR